MGLTQARRPLEPAAIDDRSEIWTKKLADGSVAVGLFNRDDSAQTIAATWAEIGVAQGRHVLDVWGGLGGPASTAFAHHVPAHGVVLLRVGP